MSRTGRPRSLSTHTLEEAANELFLEQGYAHTSIDDIAARAGISRATFFNYCDQKSDLLFVTVDEVLDALEERARRGQGLVDALVETARNLDRTRVPLVATQAETMGALEDVRVAGAVRLLRVKSIIALMVDEGMWQWAVAGGVVDAAMEWAQSPPGSQDLAQVLENLLTPLLGLLENNTAQRVL